MGNPFIEEGQDLLVLYTRGIVDANVAETVRKAEILGEEENSKFVDERLMQRSKPITETLHKTSWALSGRPSSKPSRSRRCWSLHYRTTAISFPAICHTRSGPIFCSWKQAAPPSLSLGSRLQFDTNADLLCCLEPDEPRPITCPVTNAKSFDGAAVVQMLNPEQLRRFKTMHVRYLPSKRFCKLQRFCKPVIPRRWTYLC